LTSILNDFLSLGKLEEGKVDVIKEEIHLPEFLSEVREEITPTLKQGQNIKVRCDGNVTRIYSDGRILRNILFNLLSNASKYSEVDKPIHVDCNATSEGAAFLIRDEGIGIPEDDQKHMFETFFRASNAGNVEGTGLGLNIVKRYAELLDGSITFESEYGKGSKFIVWIPNAK
jgi:signal transduction histidine kinase